MQSFHFSRRPSQVNTQLRWSVFWALGSWELCKHTRILCTHWNCKLLFQASYNPSSSTVDKKQSEPVSSYQTPWVELLFAGAAALLRERVSGAVDDGEAHYAVSANRLSTFFFHSAKPSIMLLFCRRRHFAASRQERLIGGEKQILASASVASTL